MSSIADRKPQLFKVGETVLVKKDFWKISGAWMTTIPSTYHYLSEKKVTIIYVRYYNDYYKWLYRINYDERDITNRQFSELYFKKLCSFDLENDSLYEVTE